ncbi:MAG: response regulator transcription factor [Burkholderiaceae bacterium]|nr:response regulator transcription factor [Burkholderiaceae bacterium]MCD6672542.1 response regulator transcription factor [Burkholderiaceae bacterium]
MKTLVVTDAPDAPSRIVAPLRDAGLDVEAVADTEELDPLLRVAPAGAIVLDLRENAGTPLEWLRGVRGRGIRVPALILTKAEDVDARIAALDAGASDYLAGEFEPRELVARSAALVRRREAGAADVLFCGELVVDSRKREVRCGSTPIDLTPREWSIFEQLVQHAGTPVTKEDLMQAITGADERLAPNAIEVYVSRLRAKLAGTGARISTLRGIGYRLENPQPAPARSGW